MQALAACRLPDGTCPLVMRPESVPILNDMHPHIASALAIVRQFVRIDVYQLADEGHYAYLMPSGKTSFGALCRGLQQSGPPDS